MRDRLRHLPAPSVDNDPIVIKSRAALFEPLRQCILAHHPYEVPEILALPASQGHPAYLDWLTQETS